jgi:hypothetical protein
VFDGAQHQMAQRRRFARAGLADQHKATFVGGEVEGVRDVLERLGFRRRLGAILRISRTVRVPPITPGTRLARNSAGSPACAMSWYALLAMKIRIRTMPMTMRIMGCFLCCASYHKR